MADAPASTSASGGLAVKRSVIRVILLSLITGGLYQLYWFYVTRQAVDQQLGEARSLKQTPGLQLFGTLGLGVIGGLLSIVIIGIPILIAAVVLSVVIIYFLFKDISTLRTKVGLSSFPALWFVLGPIIAGFVLAFIPPLGALVSIAALVIFGIVISKLNEYWDKHTNGKATNAQFNGTEIVVVVVGILIQIVAIVLFAAAMLAILGLSSNDADLQNEIQNQLNSSTYSY